MSERPVPRNFQSIHFASQHPGKKLIVLGAVHGNEIAGTIAIRRIIAEFEAGTRQLTCGSVTFVPITNPQAYQLKQRAGDRNLNRNLAPTDTPHDYEDHVANWLCPILAQHDVLLDLHTFQSPGQPFAMAGPHDNEGVLEAFKLSHEEESLVVRLGVHRVVDGWLATYADGVAERIKRFGDNPSRMEQLNADPRYGMGTTEYVRAHGGFSLTLECGQHDDPNAPEVAYQAICNTLAHLGLINAPAPERVRPIEALNLYKVVDRLHPDDHFSRTWASFDPVKAGDIIGTRHDGTQVITEHDGYIVFPNTKSGVGQEWFYLAQPSSRFDQVA
ncbi:succinylglutamate desuccinylase/aspartoacylase family protein [Burkholderiaceae bacterium DAT-1]|nr:succinylglutamate desuccinylase/aspartoacylase family protein [Burkholderiaceae bacterium DAT-1]